MIDLFTELEDKITASLRSANKMDGANYLVVPSHQNNPEPQTTYLSVNVLDMRSLREVRSGKYELEEVNGVMHVREDVITHYTAQVQLTFIGPEAGMYSTNRHANMLGRLVMQEFDKNGISPVRKSPLRRNPQPRGTKWVNDFVFDLTVSYAVLTADYTTEWVEKFTLLDETIVVTN